MPKFADNPRHVYELKDVSNSDHSYSVGFYTTVALAQKAAVCLTRSKIFWDEDGRCPLYGKIVSSDEPWWLIYQHPLNENPS